MISILTVSSSSTTVPISEVLAMLGAGLRNEESDNVSLEDLALLGATCIELAIDMVLELVLVPPELPGAVDGLLRIDRLYWRAETGRTTFGAVRLSRENRGVVW